MSTAEEVKKDLKHHHCHSTPWYRGTEMTRKLLCLHKSVFECHPSLNRHNKILGTWLSELCLLLYNMGLKHKCMWLSRGLAAKEESAGGVTQWFDHSGKRNQTLSSLAFPHPLFLQHTEARRYIPGGHSNFREQSKYIFLEWNTQGSHHHNVD